MTTATERTDRHRRRAARSHATALLLAACALLGSALPANATHFRYGNLSWHPVSGRTVEFTLRDAFRRTNTPSFDPCVSPSNINTVVPCTGPGGLHGVGDVIREDIGGSQLQFGDGSHVPAGTTPLVYVVTSIDLTNQWSFVEALDPASLPAIDTTISHTYAAGPSSFTAKLDDCCRISAAVSPNGHINNPDKGYTLSTNVTFTGNSSPVSTQVPIVNCPYPAVCTFTIPASDAEGDTLHWRLATSAEADSGANDGSQTFVQPGPPNAPNAASVNPSTGLYTWNTTGATLAGPGLNTLYSTQVIIEDLDAQGNVKSRTPVDFLIQLVPFVNDPPSCSAPASVTVLAGDPVGFSVSGTDPNPGDSVTLNGVGLPVGSSTTPAIPTSAPTTASTAFSWTPSSSQIGTFVVQWSATDQHGGQTLCSTTINVECNAALCGDGNDCTDDVCSGTFGSCVNNPNTAPCDDGDACTQNDTCSAGSCHAGAPVTCSASDQCHIAGTCNPQTGQCSNPIAANDTPCSDGDACTQTDTCQAGQCTGTNPVTCSASDQCHVTGTCNPQTGQCSNPSAANGTPCSDGNACTQTDTCQAGQCTGTNPVTCSASDQCHVAGTCNTQTGQCSNPTAANGTPCSDGSACTQSDSCQAGQCTGANPVTCSASDQCHVAGTCNPQTGQCSNPAAANGTPCSDGNGCTQTDSCQAGQCIGSNPVTCTASDQCHLVGVCDPETATCTNPTAPDGTPCDDQNQCTLNDQCHSGTCQGTSSTCGNGTVECGEQCDDGNHVDGDGCSSTCTKEEICGDQIDNDGNGLTDCADPTCPCPEIIDVCHHPCTSQIVFKKKGLDYARLRAAFMPVTPVAPGSEEIGILITNANGTVLNVTLPPGTLLQRGPATWKAKILSAKTTGGIYTITVWIQPDGTVRFDVRAYASMHGAATLPLMTTQIRVGNDQAVATGTWTQMSNGWRDQLP